MGLGMDVSCFFFFSYHLYTPSVGVWGYYGIHYMSNQGVGSMYEWLRRIYGMSGCSAGVAHASARAVIASNLNLALFHCLAGRGTN